MTTGMKKDKVQKMRRGKIKRAEYGNNGQGYETTINGRTTKSTDNLYNKDIYNLYSTINVVTAI